MGWLLDTSHFLTRSHCGVGWTDALRSVYMIANLTIALAYFIIPGMLLRIYRSKRQEMPSPWMLVLFASFITLCGLTHLSDVAVFYWAPYRLFTLIFALTALTSLGTAIVLPSVVRVVVHLPSRRYVHDLNDRLNQLVIEQEVQLVERTMERDERTRERDELLKELDAAREVVVSHDWITDRSAVLESLNKVTRILVDK